MEKIYFIISKSTVFLRIVLQGNFRWNELETDRNIFEGRDIKMAVKNIFISLIANRLVFSGEFPQSDEVIKLWDFQSDTVDKASLDDLCIESILKRGGWSNSDIESSPTSLRLTLKPTFFVDSLEQELKNDEQEFLDSAIKQVDQFVSKHQLVTTGTTNTSVEVDKSSEMIIYREPGQSSSREFERFIEELKSRDIKYHIEYEHSSAAEVGASGGFYEAIIFIQNTLASGVLYDLMKGVPAKYFPQVKKERIDILKGKIAHELSTQPENLEIISYEVEDECASMEVYFNRNKYQYKFSQSNEMIKYIKVV
ncbi:MAG: hypothetical protein ACQEWE_06005 [Bacillota bacterium]